MSKVEVKLDRVTVVGSFLMAKVDLEKIFVVNDWRVNYTITGDVRYELIRVTGDVTEVKAVCLENPYRGTWRLDTSNHLNVIEEDSVRQILNFMTGKHLSRIDVAFDFINMPNAGMKHRIVKPNVSQTEIYYTDIHGRNKQIETIYVGKRKSLSMIRYYDKKRERKFAKQAIPDDIKTWERLELQLRGSRTTEWINRSKEMLECFKLPELENIKDVRTKIMMTGLVEHPEYISELGYKAKAKYNKLICENVGFNTDYARQAQVILEQHAQEIADEVNLFLADVNLEI